MLIRQDLGKIPTNNYLVHFDKEKEEYYATEMDAFTLPTNIYGNYSGDITKYLSTFNSGDKNLGILLAGIKGSGKTLLAKMLMIESKLPVLVVNEPFCGNKFTEFINGINQEVIVFFDEFEKVYKEDTHQEELLTLFDGVTDSKKMFILTSNSKHINKFFINRPSRIRYRKDFTTISEETLDEIIEDLLKDKEYSRDLKDIVYSLGEVGKDLIINLIEEVNLYNIKPKEALLCMNVEIPPSSWTLKARVELKTINTDYYGNPLDEEKLVLKDWLHGVDYEEYVSSMRKVKTQGKLELQDRKGNNFLFYRKKQFNTLTNI